MKTGGPQPETWDPEAINKYFIGNFAKQWAMCDGYIPTYLGYENGVIRFKLVTDPRITGIYWISLCNYIANQYKSKVGLFKDATNFDVEHFMANDIIGFNKKPMTLRNLTATIPGLRPPMRVCLKIPIGCIKGRLGRPINNITQNSIIKKIL